MAQTVLRLDDGTEAPEDDGTTRGPAGGVVVRDARIRRLGPFVALAVPGALVGVGWAVLQWWPCEGVCARPYGSAWLLILMAFPTALAAGLPLVASPINIGATVVTSLVGWVAFGAWASRRATRERDATWRTYWRELAFMGGGVVGGVLFGLAVTAAYLRYL